jgi:hypothetical protein
MAQKVILKLRLYVTKYDLNFLPFILDIFKTFKNY